jgi:hypothetical protein
MLAMGYHDQLTDSLARHEGGEGASFPPGAERTEGNPLAAGTSGIHVHEEMAKPGLRGRDVVREAAIARKTQAREPSPFETAHAEDEATREATPEQLDPEALSRFAAREDEDRVGLSREHSLG